MSSWWPQQPCRWPPAAGRPRRTRPQRSMRTRGPAVAGVDWWSEDMMTATATNTTNRDASATVVTKARLRRLRRPRVRKAAWTGSRGSVVWLACSHRASGHDIDSDVRSQFGIGGGRFRSSSGSQTGAGGDFGAGPAPDAAAGSDAGSGAKCTTASTFALDCGFVPDPESDSSNERRGAPSGRAPWPRAPAPSCSCVGSGAFSSLGGVVVSVVAIPQYGGRGTGGKVPSNVAWPIALEGLGNAPEGLRARWP